MVDTTTFVDPVTTDIVAVTHPGITTFDSRPKRTSHSRYAEALLTVLE